MCLSQFSSINKNETVQLEIVKILHKIEENTHRKVEETLEVEITKPKQNFEFDESLIIPEKWF